MRNATSRHGRQDAQLSDGCLDPDPIKLLGNNKLLQRTPIRLPDGRESIGTLWATPTRLSGRRIQVQDRDGVLLFDTEDCYDQGNEVNRLDLWLREFATASQCRDAQMLLATSAYSALLKRA